MHWNIHKNKFKHLTVTELVKGVSGITCKSLSKRSLTLIRPIQKCLKNAQQPFSGRFPYECALFTIKHMWRSTICANISYTYCCNRCPNVVLTQVVAFIFGIKVYVCLAHLYPELSVSMGGRPDAMPKGACHDRTTTTRIKCVTYSTTMKIAVFFLLCKYNKM